MFYTVALVAAAEVLNNSCKFLCLVGPAASLCVNLINWCCAPENEKRVPLCWLALHVGERRRRFKLGCLCTFVICGFVCEHHNMCVGCELRTKTGMCVCWRPACSVPLHCLSSLVSSSLHLFIPCRSCTLPYLGHYFVLINLWIVKDKW